MRSILIFKIINLAIITTCTLPTNTHYLSLMDVSDFGGKIPLHSLKGENINEMAFSVY